MTCKKTQAIEEAHRKSFTKRINQTYAQANLERLQERLRIAQLQLIEDERDLTRDDIRNFIKGEKERIFHISFYTISNNESYPKWKKQLDSLKSKTTTRWNWGLNGTNYWDALEVEMLQLYDTEFSMLARILR